MWDGSWAWGYSTWDFQEQWILHPLVTRLSGARKAIRRSGRILGPHFKLCTLELEGPDLQKIRLLCGMCWEKVVDRSIPPRPSAFGAFDNHAAVLTASHAENSEKEQQFRRLSLSHRTNPEGRNDLKASISHARLQY